MYPLPSVFCTLVRRIRRLPQDLFSLVMQWSHEFQRVTIENNSQWKDYNETITLDLYLPRPDDPCRLTLLHPVLGGGYFVAKALAHYFALFHRRNCVIVHRGQYPFNATTPQGFEQRLQAYLYNYRIAENHLEEIGIMDLQHTQIVSIGVSMGGIVNSILATQDRYDRYITVMAGAPIIKVMYNSTMKDFDDWFKQQMKQHNVDRKTVLSMYNEVIMTDFVHSHPFIDKNKLMTISTLFDSVVPTHYQRKLVRLGRPKASVWLPTGHFSLILLTPIVLLILSWWSLTTPKTNTKIGN